MNGATWALGAQSSSSGFWQHSPVHPGYHFQVGWFLECPSCLGMNVLFREEAGLEFSDRGKEVNLGENTVFTPTHKTRKNSTK